MFTADPGSRGFRGASLRPLSCWDRGFKFRWRHGFSSRVSVLCCVSNGLCDELITRSEVSTRCVCVCVCRTVCDQGTSTVKRPNTDLGPCATKNKQVYNFLNSISQSRYYTYIVQILRCDASSHYYVTDIEARSLAHLPYPPPPRRITDYLPSKGNLFCYSSWQWYLVPVVIIVICCLYLLLSRVHFTLLKVPTAHRYGAPCVFMRKFDSESRWENIVTGY
jgi:hypothetical protein